MSSETKYCNCLKCKKLVLKKDCPCIICKYCEVHLGEGHSEPVFKDNICEECYLKHNKRKTYKNKQYAN